MATVSNSSFDAYRISATSTLQLFAQIEAWREQVVKLQQRRLERDRAALEGTLESLRAARDWTDFATASQSVLRDYLSASAAIWQDAVAAAMQGAGTWTDTARDLAQSWQDSLSGFQPAAGTSALPMREWMAAFEHAVSAAGANAAYGMTSAAGTGHTQAAGKEAVHGEQHGR